METTKIRCGLQTRSLPVKVDLKMSHPVWHLNLSSIHWRACKDSRLFIFYRQWIPFFFLTERGQGRSRETRYPDKRLKKNALYLEGCYALGVSRAMDTEIDSPDGSYRLIEVVYGRFSKAFGGRGGSVNGGDEIKKAFAWICFREKFSLLAFTDQ